VKIASDNSDIEVMVTRGVEGRPPDIWLRWLSDMGTAGPMLVRITIDEARELANLLLLKVNNAHESD